MIILTSKQITDLADAFKDAFDLVRLKKIVGKTGRNLEWESGGSDGEAIVLSLIGKAQRNRWIHELIEAAVNENPIPKLLAIADELRPAIIAATRDHFNVIFVDNNVALVNRTFLRQSLKQLASSDLTGARILVVNGPEMSGKTYSMELVAYLNRALQNFKIVHIDLKKTSGEVKPEHIAGQIVDQMLLEANVMPALDQEQDARWIQLFCSRLQGVLSNVADVWWIVIDGFNHHRLSTPVNDLVKELASRIRLTMPRLRMVLLSYNDNLSPDVERVALRETIDRIDERHLTSFFNQVYMESNKTYFPKDIAERIGEVLRAVDPQSARYMEMLGTEVVKVAKQISA